MRFVKLTDRGGNPIYVNPAQVLTIEPYPIYRADVHVGTGAKLSFALVGSHTTDAGQTDVEAYKEIVVECPTQVAAIFLDPVR